MCFRVSAVFLPWLMICAKLEDSLEDLFFMQREPWIQTARTGRERRADRPPTRRGQSASARANGARTHWGSSTARTGRERRADRPPTRRGQGANRARTGREQSANRARTGRVHLMGGVHLHKMICSNELDMSDAWGARAGVRSQESGVATAARKNPLSDPKTNCRWLAPIRSRIRSRLREKGCQVPFVRSTLRAVPAKGT